MATQIVLQGIDWLQTLKIARNPDRYWERNSIIGEHPSRTRVNVYMGATLIVKTALSYYAPDIMDALGFSRKTAKRSRKFVQGIFIAPSAYCVGNNLDIGLGIGIEF